MVGYCPWKVCVSVQPAGVDWINHIEFEDDIVKLFRIYKTKEIRYQAILLRNGDVYIGVLDFDVPRGGADTEKEHADRGKSSEPQRT